MQDDYFPDTIRNQFNSIDGIIFINFLAIQIIKEIFTPKPKNIHLPNQTFSMFSVIGMYMDMNDMIPDSELIYSTHLPQPQLYYLQYSSYSIINESTCDVTTSIRV